MNDFIRLLVVSIVILFASGGCGRSCHGERAGKAAGEIGAITDYLPADAVFATMVFAEEGDPAVWDGYAPPGARPTQVIGGLVSDVFRDLGGTDRPIAYSQFGPGAFGGYYDGTVLLTLIEMEDARGFVEAVTGSLGDGPRAAARRLETSEGDGGLVSVSFEFWAILAEGRQQAALTAHDGLVALAIGGGADRDELVERTRSLVPAEKNITTTPIYERSRTGIADRGDVRAVTVANLRRLSEVLRATNGSTDDQCEAFETEFLSRHDYAALVAVESSSALTFQLRLPIDESATRFDELAGTALNVAQSVGNRLPIVWSMGTRSINRFEEYSGDSAARGCDNLVGRLARLRFEAGRMLPIDRLLADSALSVISGMPSLLREEGRFRVLTRFLWPSDEASTAFFDRAVPMPMRATAVGSMQIDDAELPVYAVNVAMDPLFFAKNGAEVWRSTYRFSEEQTAALMLAQPIEATMAIAVAPAALRREITVLQQQMDVSAETIVSGMRAAEIDPMRVAAALELTNALIAMIKPVARIEMLVTRDGDDLLVTVR